MATILVIDDERTFKSDKDITYARTSHEGIAAIAKQYSKWATQPLHQTDQTMISELYLDHDLGGSDTIRPVATYLSVMAAATAESPTLNFQHFIGSIYVHSQNPTTDWIVQILNGSFENVSRIALPELEN